MTKITIFKKEDKIWAYQIKGHSGYAEEGNDIVCSGISTAAQMAYVGLKEILNLQVSLDTHEAYMHVKLTDVDLQNQAAQAILKAMEVTVKNIAKNYARNVKVEVKKDVY